jgi:transposase InsO family protein
VAVPWLGIRFRWRDTSFFLEGASVCVGGHRLLHQVAVPLKRMTHDEVIRFLKEHIIHRFAMPQTLTTDQGASFMSHQLKEFATSLKIRLLNLLPYYTKANGQAESSNKVLIKLIKKKIDESLRR